MAIRKTATEATDAEVEAVKSSLAQQGVELKHLEPNQTGVTEIGNIRMVKLAAPICPIRQGYPESSPRYQPEFKGQSNCTFVGNVDGRPWWQVCESKGHDPYFQTFEVVTEENIVDADGYVTGTRKKVRTERRLNMVQVPLGIRYNSGRAVENSRRTKGRKTLGEMGYAEACQYRNCELDAKVRTKFGLYCAARHARLVGADAESVIHNTGPSKKDRQQWEAELAEIDIDYQGYEDIGAPFDGGQDNSHHTDTWMTPPTEDTSE